MDEQLVRELREQLQTFERRLSSLTDSHEVRGESLSASSVRSLQLLLDMSEVDEEQPMLTDLVELLGIDKSNVTRLCQRLEEAGYIELRRDEHDRRIKRVYLTEHGLEMAREVNKMSFQRYGEVLDTVPTEHHRSVVHSVALLNEALVNLFGG